MISTSLVPSAVSATAALRTSVQAARQPPTWDLLVIGGGIMGAAIMREAASRGLSVLLVERHDFASGTSSRSSKLVHGGLHYLARLHLRLAGESSRERRRLLQAGRGLVNPLRVRFIVPPRGAGPSHWQCAAVLTAYNLLDGRFRVARHAANGVTDEAALEETRTLRENMLPHAPAGTFIYDEATTDDARLVLRLLREGARLGGRALNYVAAEALLRDANGRVVGATLKTRTGERTDVRARAVINATGPWADALRRQLGETLRLRYVRGSHLILPRRRLPLAGAVAALDPATGQPAYFVPWQGVTLVGSTAIEQSSMEDTTAVTPDEFAALLARANSLFPGLRLTRRDVQCTFSGVRPIIDPLRREPGLASREEAIWEEAGMITVTGGKLTTSHAIACRVLERLQLSRFPHMRPASLPLPLDTAEPPPPERTHELTGLTASYGAQAVEAMLRLPIGEWQRVPGAHVRWCELRWAARAENVHHLEDLMLRRVRLGLTLPRGGEAILPRLRDLLQEELGWTGTRWRDEVDAYRTTWRLQYGVPRLH